MVEYMVKRYGILKSIRYKIIRMACNCKLGTEKMPDRATDGRRHTWKITGYRRDKTIKCTGYRPALESVLTT